MARAYLSLGSNIEPEKNVCEAIKLLSKRVKVLRVSTTYLTEPLERKNQPQFYNCVLEIETHLTPVELKFSVLREVEKELGRKRTRDRFAPRTIDIDIALYGELYAYSEKLKIPDPNIYERPFLAASLCELNPDLQLPPSGTPIKLIVEKLGKHGMTALEPYTKNLRMLVKSLSV